MARLNDATDAELRGEFAAIRARLPTPWGRFVWRRLIVLPRSFARFRKVTGGACVWWFWVVADPALADAPADARRFVLAHEWGHVARGHAARLLAFWTLCFPLVWIIWMGVQGTRCALLGPIAALFALWGSMVLRSIRLEFEADHVATEPVGVQGGPRAILTLVEWAGQTWKPSHTRRLAALRALANHGAGLPSERAVLPA
ncbi:MAG: M48 family metalloprotease [Rhodospirillales bacterium]|nr:M48 family metalloprotease [Rhodospirillales bacterium]